jgi:hypothetical protein
VIFSVDASARVGDKRGAPIAADLAVNGNRWSGEVAVVRLDLDPTEGGAVIPAEDLLRVAMATQ